MEFINCKWIISEDFQTKQGNYSESTVFENCTFHVEKGKPAINYREHKSKYHLKLFTLKQKVKSWKNALLQLKEAKKTAQ